MTAHSKIHHTPQHNPTILNTKTFLRQPVTRAIKYHPIQNMIQTHIQVVTLPFYFFRVAVTVRFTVHSSTRAQLVYITPHDYTSCFFFYFYVLCKYYHTHEEGGVLDNPYSLQVYHASKDGVVLGMFIGTNIPYVTFVLTTSNRTRLKDIGTRTLIALTRARTRL